MSSTFLFLCYHKHLFSASFPWQIISTKNLYSIPPPKYCISSFLCYSSLILYTRKLNHLPHLPICNYFLTNSNIIFLCRRFKIANVSCNLFYSSTMLKICSPPSIFCNSAFFIMTSIRCSKLEAVLTFPVFVVTINSFHILTNWVCHLEPFPKRNPNTVTKYSFPIH